MISSISQGNDFQYQCKDIHVLHCKHYLASDDLEAEPLFYIISKKDIVMARPVQLIIFSQILPFCWRSCYVCELKIVDIIQISSYVVFISD